jgi:uncharacterized protein YyaL (SSP411 family)
MANRLAGEKSPYLLQHADNPVDWQPWGDEAFSQARGEDKPIFLSIGYATCHWCHVMAHESFEDAEVAALLNRHFVAIKVDREERPDLDGVYMSVCQALTGSGGWPLSVFLTPEGKPFHAGTYFPKHTMMGRPGFVELLTEIARLWREDRDRLLAAGDQITKAIQPRPGPGAEPDLGLLEKAYWALFNSFDEKRGGFGQAPKFPTPHQLNFLLRWHLRQPGSRALDMVDKTLRAMRAGGIFDQVGLGFARYSVDERWLVPHFEKMLYDQALLAMAYTEAHQATGEAFHARAAEEIFTYVLRDMTHAQGGFFSAEDADSEGHEGLFYVWTPQQVDEVLGQELGGLFCRFYGVTTEGNFEHGMSIPHVSVDEATFAQRLGLDPAKVGADLARARELLFAAREQRVHPLKDDKVLTAWNGLMIAALAKAGAALGRADWTAAAARAASFVLARLSDDEGRLLRRWRDGHTTGPGYLDDYAFLAWGLVELYEADLDPRWLAEGLRLSGLMCRFFEDELHGGFFYTAHDAEGLIVREKEVFDGALPSGNSAAAYVMLRLARLTGEGLWERKAAKLFHAFAPQIQRHPPVATQLLVALDLALAEGVEVVLAGDSGEAATQDLIAAAQRSFAPRKALLLAAPGPIGERLAELAPFTRGMGPVEGKPAAYVCRAHACQRPVTSADELKALLT